jgi:hypothetical protein
MDLPFLSKIQISFSSLSKLEIVFPITKSSLLFFKRFIDLSYNLFFLFSTLKPIIFDFGDFLRKRDIILGAFFNSTISFSLSEDIFPFCFIMV